MTALDISTDIIDIRDIIERIEGLEVELEQCPDNFTFEDGEELRTLTAIMAELAGYGGDEQWRDDWYPLTLIRDSYFRDYAQELAEDIGAVDRNASWPNNCIDWDQAARDLRVDYSSVEIDGITYLYR